MRVCSRLCSCTPRLHSPLHRGCTPAAHPSAPTARSSVAGAAKVRVALAGEPFGRRGVSPGVLRSARQTQRCALFAAQLRGFGLRCCELRRGRPPLPPPDRSRASRRVRASARSFEGFVATGLPETEPGARSPETTTGLSLLHLSFRTLRELWNRSRSRSRSSRSCTLRESLWPASEEQPRDSGAAKSPGTAHARGRGATGQKGAQVTP